MTGLPAFLSHADQPPLPWAKRDMERQVTPFEECRYEVALTAAVAMLILRP